MLCALLLLEVSSVEGIKRERERVRRGWGVSYHSSSK